jgi:hypothetical protein
LAILQTYLDERLAGAARFTERVRRTNRGALLRDTAPGTSSPPSAAAFSVTISDVAQDGTFPADGFAERITAWAKVTVDAWSSR